MIGRLAGRLHQLEPGSVLVDVAGVGYLVSTTLRAYQQLVRQDEGALWIHTQVRDDAIVLFGFLDRDELRLFEQLIAVAGVGPRTALAVLSGLAPRDLAQAVDAGDVALLQRAPGVGRKTAERIILELKGKLGGGEAPATDRAGDAVSALVNLGYASRDARRAVAAVAGAAPDLELDELLRQALQRLTR